MTNSPFMSLAQKVFAIVVLMLLTVVMVLLITLHSFSAIIRADNRKTNVADQIIHFQDIKILFMEMESALTISLFSGQKDGLREFSEQLQPFFLKEFESKVQQLAAQRRRETTEWHISRIETLENHYEKWNAAASEIIASSLDDDKSESEWTTTTYARIKADLFPLQFDANLYLGEIINALQYGLDREQSELEALCERISYIILVVGISGTLLAMIAAYVVLRGTTKRLRDIARSIAECGTRLHELIGDTNYASPMSTEERQRFSKELAEESAAVALLGGELAAVVSGAGPNAWLKLSPEKRAAGGAGEEDAVWMSLPPDVRSSILTLACHMMKRNGR